MAMPDFIQNVESGSKQAGWLTPATVADLSESDFVTMPGEQREQLFKDVESFRAFAKAAETTPAEKVKARNLLDTILDILRPYQTPESLAIQKAVWQVWKDEKEWIATFDYELAESWIGSPIVWIWLVLRDEVDIEARQTRERLSRVRMAIRMNFQDAAIERWPNIGVRMASEVKELTARATA